MKVRFTRQASSDLREIKAHYDEEGPVATTRVLKAIISAINLLRLRPAIGLPNLRTPEIRSKLVVDYPFRIHYRVRQGALEILHIRHTARRPWLETRR